MRIRDFVCTLCFSLFIVVIHFCFVCIRIASELWLELLFVIVTFWWFYTFCLCFLMDCAFFSWWLSQFFIKNILYCFRDGCWPAFKQKIKIFDANFLIGADKFLRVLQWVLWSSVRYLNKQLSYELISFTCRVHWKFSEEIGSSLRKQFERERDTVACDRC